MNVIFFGSTSLGFKCCQALISQGVEVSRIFSIPQTFSIKYRDKPEKSNVTNVLFKDFRFFEEEYGIPVHFVEGNIREYEEEIRRLDPELIIVIGWYFMIPRRILEIPNKGSVAIHSSLLPKYRGNAPLVWAMINGEKETGVSLFYLEGGMDEGDIISQAKFNIDRTDTIKEVLARAEEASLMIIQEQVPAILAGRAGRMKQDNDLATYYPKRSPEDGKIDWSWSKGRIQRFIRAQTRPYPGAFTIIDGKKVIIWDADII